MKKRPVIIVIGGNAAGAAAAAKAKRTSPDTDVWLLEKSDVISTGTCEIPYAISGEVKDYKSLIFYTPEKFHDEKKVNVLIRHQAEFIDRKKKLLTVNDLSSGKLHTISYDKLILATGSSTRTLDGIDNSTGNFFNLKTINDLRMILEYLGNKSVRKGVIFGAGYVGLELAESLTSRGIQVTLIEKNSSPFPEAEPEFREIIKKLLDEKKIDFITTNGNASFRFSEGKVISLINASQVIEGDLFFNCTGFIPNVSLAKASGLKIGETGAIAVNNYLQTSDPDIFVAGDCAESTDFITGKKTLTFSAIVAHQQGHLAGNNAVSINRKISQRVIKNTAVRLFNSYFVQVGLTEEESRTAGFSVGVIKEMMPNLVSIMPGSAHTFIKLNFDKISKKILGASLWGSREVSGYADIIQLMIRLKIPAYELSGNYFNYTPTLSPFWNILSVIGRKIK